MSEEQKKIVQLQDAIKLKGWTITMQSQDLMNYRNKLQIIADYIRTMLEEDEIKKENLEELLEIVEFNDAE